MKKKKKLRNSRSIKSKSLFLNFYIKNNLLYVTLTIFKKQKYKKGEFVIKIVFLGLKKNIIQ